jgi:hypothetical protein
MKAYVVVLLAVAMAAILGVIAANIFIDPYSIVHPLLGEYYFEPNSRVPKVAWLSKNCSRYDSYFVGDSRSGTLSARDLADAKGQRFYNLSTPADDIASIVRRLKFLIGKGCPISTVIAAESIDVLLDPDEKESYSLLLRENPDVTGENRLAFYARFFLSAQALTTYFWSVGWHRPPRDFYHTDGHVDYYWSMQDGSDFALARCRTPGGEVHAGRQLSAKLAGYRDLAELAAKQQFKAVVWIAPLNKASGALLDDPEISDFLARLREIPNLRVIQADRDSPLLEDFRAWHDCGHFRRIIFDQLVAPEMSRSLKP